VNSFKFLVRLVFISFTKQVSEQDVIPITVTELKEHIKNVIEGNGMWIGKRLK
jgi:hypothetical protein